MQFGQLVPGFMVSLMVSLIMFLRLAMMLVFVTMFIKHEQSFFEDEEQYMCSYYTDTADDFENIK